MLPDSRVELFQVPAGAGSVQSTCSLCAIAGSILMQLYHPLVSAALKVEYGGLPLADKYLTED